MWRRVLQRGHLRFTTSIVELAEETNLLPGTFSLKTKLNKIMHENQTKLYADKQYEGNK